MARKLQKTRTPPGVPFSHHTRTGKCLWFYVVFLSLKHDFDYLQSVKGRTWRGLPKISSGGGKNEEDSHIEVCMGEGSQT